MQPTTLSSKDVCLAPRRLAHANIFVSDLERSMQFYQSVCGIAEVFREPGINAGFLSNGNSHHDVGLMGIANQARVGKDCHVQVVEGRGRVPGLNHLGLEMANETLLAQAWARLVAAGQPCRTTDHGMSHSIYVFDPEGNYLEFYCDMIDDWRAFYAGNENQLISGDWKPDPASADSAERYTRQFTPDRVEPAPCHPRRIGRATLLVDDLAAMVDYYTGFAGLNLVAGGVGAGYAVLAGTAGEPAISLFPAAGGKRGLHHLGFELGSEAEVEAATASLRQAGVPIAAQIDHAAKKSLVIADPDGLLMEFYAPRTAALPRPDDLPQDQRFYLL